LRLADIARRFGATYTILIIAGQQIHLLSFGAVRATKGMDMAAREVVADSFLRYVEANCPAGNKVMKRHFR
jgi:hypothetical protein